LAIVIYTFFKKWGIETYRKKLIGIFLGDRIREGDWKII
jgi:hypothetical protein